MARGTNPFEVYVRREPGYELRLTVRYEVADGHGILALQRPGARETAPATVYEERDIEAGILRAGRFIHVQSGSTRRQSYAMSRLAEEALQVISDERWTRLDAITEYGFRYLVVPEDALQAPPEEPTPAAVPVGSAGPAPARIAVAPAAARMPTPAPAAARGATPPPAPPAAAAAVPVRAAVAPPGPPSAPSAPAPGPRAARSVAKAGGPPSALQRAMSALKDGVEPQDLADAAVKPAAVQAGPTRIPLPKDPAAAAPAPAGAPAAGARRAPHEAPPARPVSYPEPDLAGLRAMKPKELLAAAEAQAHALAELRARVADLERKLNDGVAREHDLLEILGRWQQRELGNR